MVLNTKNLNTLLGWLSFLIAMAVYGLTVERTASFWDCGEFISASYLLQVVHPPGAPLFLLLGNLFSQFASAPEQVGFMVNMLSVVVSALTVMFTFWTITHFASRLVQQKEMNEKTRQLLVLGSGMVGALALMFSDTFWFSAVEAEVYAASSFLSAVTFWCILKWEHASDKPGANRWLILISYLIGLGIGVHLLNLLVIPAIVYLYYFKKYEMNRKNFFLSSIIGLGILGFVQVGIIPGIPTLAAYLDRWFVNDLGMGFGSGVIFLAVLLVGLIVFALFYSQKRKLGWLNLGTLCFAFILIGYSSYAMVVIRSLANPPIDMNDPQDPFNLVSYLNREQYGDRPLLKGPYFNARAIDVEEGKQSWRKGAEAYEKAGIEPKYVWDPKYVTFFPRMGDMQKASSPAGYSNWAGADKDKKPTMGQNIGFFIKYQLGHMYWRYFLWNFAGRQNMLQGDGDPLNGNWISGIGVLDQMRLGPQSNLPDTWANDKARNKYYMLPLILGLMGLLFQFSRNKNDFFVVMMLFLFTGILIAVYLNAPPYEPRERDYTLVGSFQIFCIWIGLGVIQFYEWIRKRLAGSAAAVSVAASILLVPVLMGFQNWDDHDRSGRDVVVQYGRNYLKSCEPNAILFTNGDNDTYPLWYVQNVEGFRTDVRVVNLQLLNFDWYVEALTRKVLESEPFVLSVAKDKYAKGLREQVPFYESPNVKVNENEYYPWKQVLAFITNDTDPNTKRPWYFDEQINFVPVRNMKIEVNREQVLQSGQIAPEDLPYLVDEMRFSLQSSALLKADWVALDLIQQNHGTRPIYFASNSVDDNYLGLGQFFRLDGLAFKLVPLSKPPMPRIPVLTNTEVFYRLMMDSFHFGGLNNPDILLDEQCIRMTNTFRNYAGILSLQLAAEGRKDSVLKLINKVVSELPPHIIPYDNHRMVIPMVRACYELGEMERGDEILLSFVEEQEQIIQYLDQFKGRRGREVQTKRNGTLTNMQEVYKISSEFSRNVILNRVIQYKPIQ